MLNRGERYEVLRVIRRCCVLGFLPAEVDLLTWDLLPRANTKKVWLCRLSLFLLVAHAMFNVGTLMRAYFFETGTPLHETIIHAQWAMAVPVYISWYYVLFIKHSGVFATYLKITLTGTAQGAMADRRRTRPWCRRVQECTSQDLLAMTMPYMILSGIVAVMFVFMCYPTMKLQLYAYIPKTYQSWTVFSLLLLEELRLLLGTLCTAIIALTLQILSIELVRNLLQQLIHSMERTGRRQGFNATYKALRHIQLYVGIANQLNSFIIFSYKVLCITICIGAGYAAIAHFGDHPICGVMYYVILGNSACIYTFSYAKAFKIPALFEEATRIAVLHAHKRKYKAVATFERQMRSIPRVGIKVGEFHFMERQSTLIFIHFVLDNIVSMLVAYRPG